MLWCPDTLFNLLLANKAICLCLFVFLSHCFQKHFVDPVTDKKHLPMTVVTERIEASLLATDKTSEVLFCIVECSNILIDWLAYLFSVINFGRRIYLILLSLNRRLLPNLVSNTSASILMLILYFKKQSRIPLSFFLKLCAVRIDS